MSTEAVLAQMKGLTDVEANFVYNCEVLGLPVGKAASMAGLAPGTQAQPHLMQARETLKREMRATLQITKEDVVHGMREAIYRAQIINEPSTEIIGWEKIAKLLGYDAPARIDINLTASLDVLKSQVRQLTDAELVRSVGANAIIDADFYVKEG